MAGRWASLPSSDQEIQHLSATTPPTTPVPTTLDPLALLRTRVGSLIKEEAADYGRTICYYRHMDTDEGLPFMCEFGCCPGGCCVNWQSNTNYNPFSWALALLAILLLVILIAIMALLAVYWVNRRQTKEMRRQMMINSGATESSNVSQISGPGSYYYPEGNFYSYGTNKEQQY